MRTDDQLGMHSRAGDFTALGSPHEYNLYLAQLRRVFRHIGDCYPHGCGAAESEGAVIRRYVEMLLSSFSMLQLKHGYPAADDRPLWVDVTESGFPNQIELAELESDLKNKSELLRHIPSSTLLKRTLADELFRSPEAPREVLRQLSRRTYLEQLEADKVFLPFNAGGAPRLVGSDERYRRYVSSFACYDFATNRPYIHFLSFDHDRREEPLEGGSAALVRFTAAVRAEGSRAPDVAVLASGLDEALDTVHPKMLKRLGIGPLYSNILLHEHSAGSDNARELYFKELLQQFGREEHDFVLLLTEESVFSKRQVTGRGVFSSGKVREIFSISETDPECAARRASAVMHYFLMPHQLLQHVAPGKSVHNFAGAKKLSVDDLGDVHGL